MAKGLGGFTNAGAVPGSRGERRCVACKRRIIWGPDRCPSCRQELAARPTSQAPMRTLLRPCLGCGRSVRGKPRCQDCQRDHDRAKRQRRPDLDDAAERNRRRQLVADHRARVGDWCPGLGDHPAHPCADLVADHVVEVAVGGPPNGQLRVLCRSENSRRSANVARLFLPPLPTTPRQPELPTLFESTDDGPSVA